MRGWVEGGGGKGGTKLDEDKMAKRSCDVNEVFLKVVHFSSMGYRMIQDDRGR